MAKRSPTEIIKLVKESRERLEDHFNAPAQPKLPTIAPKIAIEAAIPGWQAKGWYEERGVHNLPPISFQDQADCIAECVKAGASIIHTHPRDPDTGLTTPADWANRHRHTECLMEVMDRAHEQVDFVTAHHTWTWDFAKSLETDYISDTQDLLEGGTKKGIGNFYVQLAMIMTIPVFRAQQSVHTAASIQKGVQWMEANNIKPMFSTESFAIDRFNMNLFANGIAKWTPYWIAIQEGKHDDDRTFGDPWAAIETITSIGLVKSLLGEKALIGFHPAGRNWLQVAANAILNGAEFIRVGIEDQFYLYPHRDDISKNASDTTKIVADFIQALGSEVASPADIRKRANIKLTA